MLSSTLMIQGVDKDGKVVFKSMQTDKLDKFLVEFVNKEYPGFFADITSINIDSARKGQVILFSE